MQFSCLFGPVPSRRLGISLGVDLLPFKTCTLNCVYCECGDTTSLRVTRKEYKPPDTVIKELGAYLENRPYLDFITFSGSGEPTLHSNLSRIIQFIKKRYPEYKVCILTNGTLFNRYDVRLQVQQADLIVPSLDAATEEIFQKINRPHHSLKCKDVISGLIKLRQEYKGELHLEIFVVPGLNDTAQELAAIKKALRKIRPDLVQLGTLDRPGTEKWVKGAEPHKMLEIAAYLDGAEIIQGFCSQHKVDCLNNNFKETILQTLKRRPCTLPDLCKLLDVRRAEVQKYLHYLLKTGQIEFERKKRGDFIKLKI